MTVVLVHGNPETAAIWDDLREQLGRDDVIALSPPGFGAPVLDGFGATSDDYAAWLATEVAKLPGPIDLVGHDWGGGHVMRLVIAQPELVRSWAMDIAGCFDPEYVWHERAQVWQTPGAGESAIEKRAGMCLPRRHTAALRRTRPTWRGAFSRCIARQRSRGWLDGTSSWIAHERGQAW
jgi:pimeloyl-ACP methyl ester carboxylesterase